MLEIKAGVAPVASFSDQHFYLFCVRNPKVVHELLTGVVTSTVDSRQHEVMTS